MPGTEEWGEVSQTVIDTRGINQPREDLQVENFQSELRYSLDRLHLVTGMIEMFEEQEILQSNLDLPQKMAEFGISNVDNHLLGDKCLTATIISTYGLDSENVKQIILESIESNPQLNEENYLSNSIDFKQTLDDRLEDQKNEIIKISQYNNKGLLPLPSVRQIIEENVFPYLRNGNIKNSEIGPSNPLIIQITYKDGSTAVVLISAFQVKQDGIWDEYIKAYNHRAKTF
jgi:hypothetical protein